GAPLGERVLGPWVGWVRVITGDSPGCRAGQKAVRSCVALPPPANTPPGPGDAAPEGARFGREDEKRSAWGHREVSPCRRPESEHRSTRTIGHNLWARQKIHAEGYHPTRGSFAWARALERNCPGRPLPLCCPSTGPARRPGSEARTPG